MENDRHIPYFEFSEACAAPGCPICSIVAKRGSRWMENLLFEHVSDRPFRAAFRAAGGFCPEHARDLGSSRDGLALAILYRDALAESLRLIEKRKVTTGRCPACIEREKVETEYLGLLREAEGELRATFESSSGLCLSHYIELLRQKKRVPIWIKSHQTRLFESLLERTDKFIELSAYGRQAEFDALPREDQLIWQEILEKARKRNIT